jgi:hypothetical protein
VTNKPETSGELPVAIVWILLSILWLVTPEHGGSFARTLHWLWFLTLGVWLYRAARTIYQRFAQGKTPDVH